MLLTSLPTELVLIIVSFLRAFEVERLAQTLNKELYAICSPLIASRVAARRSTKRMRSLFGTGREFSTHMDWGCYSWLGLEAKYGPFAENLTPNLDFLDLNGDLSWLGPEAPFEFDDEVVSGTIIPYWADRALWERILDELASQAKRVGVELPRCLTTLVRSEQLLRLVRYYWVEMDPADLTLLKCPASISGNNSRDYILHLFQCINGDCWGLYLEAGHEKGHCVVQSYGNAPYPNLPYPHSESTEELNHITQDDIDAAKIEGNWFITGFARMYRFRMFEP